jgi:hypothetical protein
VEHAGNRKGLYVTFVTYLEITMSEIKTRLTNDIWFVRGWIDWAFGNCSRQRRDFFSSLRLPLGALFIREAMGPSIDARMPAWSQTTGHANGVQGIYGKIWYVTGVNSEQIVATLDNEISRLQHARTLIAQSASGKAPGRSHVRASATKPKTRTLSAAARERIAAAQRKRWVAQKKQAAVAVTRVAAKEAPKRRAPKPVSKPKTSLTGNVPKGPIAAPAKR